MIESGQWLQIGRSMKRTKKIDDNDLQSILLNPKLNRRGQYICDCPFCGKERHFYISKQTQLFDCKKCGEYGSIYKLLKALDKSYLLGGPTVEDREVITSIRKMIQEEAGEDEVQLTELPEVLMPAGWKVAVSGIKYLRDRGVTSVDCRRYNIGQTRLFRKYKNYILMPVYDGGIIRGFVGRYGAKQVPENRLRYNNSVGTVFSQLLYGYDEITTNTLTVILVEGIFDKIAVDKFLDLWSSEEIKCVCTFGKKISREQVEKLKIKGVSNVVLLYDFDALKDIKKYGLELENDFVTAITYTTKKDIDECSEEEAMDVFTNLQKPRKFNVDVIGKLK